MGDFGFLANAPWLQRARPEGQASGSSPAQGPSARPRIEIPADAGAPGPRLSAADRGAALLAADRAARTAAPGAPAGSAARAGGVGPPGAGDRSRGDVRGVPARSDRSVSGSGAFLASGPNQARRAAPEEAWRSGGSSGRGGAGGAGGVGGAHAAHGAVRGAPGAPETSGTVRGAPGAPETPGTVRGAPGAPETPGTVRGAPGAPETLGASWVGGPGVASPSPPPPRRSAAPSSTFLSSVPVPEPSLADATVRVLVSARQKGNPLLSHLRPGSWGHCPGLVPDYVPYPGVAVLFLSLKFALLKPDYILGRLKALRDGPGAGPGAEAYYGGGAGAEGGAETGWGGAAAGGAISPHVYAPGSWRVRVLLLVVDVEERGGALLAVSRAAIAERAALLCCWSPAEAAATLAALRRHAEARRAAAWGRPQGAPGAAASTALVADAFSNSLWRPAGAAVDFAGTFAQVLAAVRGVTKADVRSLAERFGSVARVAQATREELSLVPGLGPTKVRRIHDAFHEPFRRELATHPDPAWGGEAEEANEGASGGGAGDEGAPREDDGEGGDATAPTIDAQPPANARGEDAERPPPGSAPATAGAPGTAAASAAARPRPAGQREEASAAKRRATAAALLGDDDDDDDDDWWSD